MRRRDFLRWFGLAALVHGCGSNDSGVLTGISNNPVPSSAAAGASSGFTPPVLARLSRDSVVAFDATGNLYEAFSNTTEIRCSDPKGRLRWSFLNRGRVAGRLNFPVALAVDLQGRTWVVDSGLG